MEQTKSQNDPTVVVKGFMDAWLKEDWKGMVKYCQPIYIDAYKKAGLKPEQALWSRLVWGKVIEGYTGIELKGYDDIETTDTINTLVIIETKNRSYGLTIGLVRESEVYPAKKRSEWKISPTTIFEPIS